MTFKRILSIVLIVTMIGLAASCAGNGVTGPDNSAGSGGPDSSVSPNSPDTSKTPDVSPGESASPSPSPSGGPDTTASPGVTDDPATATPGESTSPGSPSPTPGSPSPSPSPTPGSPSPSPSPSPTPDPTPSGGLSGSAADILSQLVADMIATGITMPMLPPPAPVLADASQYTIGLSTADFGKLVVSAATTQPMIGTFAHQFVVIEAVDAKSAVEVRKLIAGSGGYDAAKWICVFPDKAVAVDCGVYVLLAASSTEGCDNIVEALKSRAGSIGEVDEFYERAQ